MWYKKTVIGYNSLLISITLKSKLFQVFYMLRRMIIHRILLVCNLQFSIMDFMVPSVLCELTCLLLLISVGE